MGEVGDLNSWKCCCNTVLWAYVAEHLIAVSSPSSKGKLSPWLGGMHSSSLSPGSERGDNSIPPSAVDLRWCSFLLSMAHKKASFYDQWLRWMELTLMSCSICGIWPGAVDLCCRIRTPKRCFPWGAFVRCVLSWSEPLSIKSPSPAWVKDYIFWWGTLAWFN